MIFIFKYYEYYFKIIDLWFSSYYMVNYALKIKIWVHLTFSQNFATSPKNDENYRNALKTVENLRESSKTIVLIKMSIFQKMLKNWQKASNLSKTIKNHQKLLKNVILLIYRFLSFSMIFNSFYSIRCFLTVFDSFWKVIFFWKKWWFLTDFDDS